MITLLQIVVPFALVAISILALISMAGYVNDRSSQREAEEHARNT